MRPPHDSKPPHGSIFHQAIWASIFAIFVWKSLRNSIYFLRKSLRSSIDFLRKSLRNFIGFLGKSLRKTTNFLRKCLWSFHQFSLILWLFLLFSLRFRNVSLLVILKNNLISLCFLQNNYINFKNIITSKKFIYLEKKGTIRSQFSFYDDTIFFFIKNFYLE